MSEYISREKLNDLLDEFTVMDGLYNAIQAIPTENVTPVIHGQIIWKERHRGGFKTAKCLHCFNDINTESNIPCKHIAKIDGRYTINEPYCSKCGKLLGNFLNYCGNCGAKMEDKNDEM